MKVIVAGGREFTGKHVVQGINELAEGIDISEVVCGGSTGVAQEGADWAVERDIKVERFWPKWAAHGMNAGPMRNAAMAKYADALILVWDGFNRDAKDLKKKAKAEGLLVKEKVLGKRVLYG